MIQYQVPFHLRFRDWTELGEEVVLLIFGNLVGLTVRTDEALHQWLGGRYVVGGNQLLHQLASHVRVCVSLGVLLQIFSYGCPEVRNGAEVAHLSCEFVVQVRELLCFHFVQ